MDALYAPRRTVLDPILVDAAEAAGAEVRFGVSVAEVDRDGCGRVSGVAGRTREGAEFRAGARIVVGADGFRSTVAARVGAPVERVGTGVGATTYGYWPGLDVAGYEWNFRPDAASGVIPTNDGLTCVFASATRTPDRPRRAGAAARDPRARPTRTSPAGSRPRRRPRCAPSPGCAATSVAAGDRAGRWSVTPATSRTRSARTG